MPLGSEPSSAGMVGNLGRVPGISAAARGLMGHQVDGGGCEGDEEEEVGDEGGGGGEMSRNKAVVKSRERWAPWSTSCLHAFL